MLLDTLQVAAPLLQRSQFSATDAQTPCWTVAVGWATGGVVMAAERWASQVLCHWTRNSSNFASNDVVNPHWRVSDLQLETRCQPDRKDISWLLSYPTHELMKLWVQKQLIIAFLSVKLLQRARLAVTASQFGKLLIFPTQSDGLSEFCALVDVHSYRAIVKRSMNTIAAIVNNCLKGWDFSPSYLSNAMGWKCAILIAAAVVKHLV
jgi:hypothetical protein